MINYILLTICGLIILFGMVKCIKNYKKIQKDIYKESKKIQKQKEKLLNKTDFSKINDDKSCLIDLDSFQIKEIPLNEPTSLEYNYEPTVKSDSDILKELSKIKTTNKKRKNNKKVLNKTNTSKIKRKRNTKKV